MASFGFAEALKIDTRAAVARLCDFVQLCSEEQAGVWLAHLPFVAAAIRFTNTLFDRIDADWQKCFWQKCPSPGPPAHASVSPGGLQQATTAICGFLAMLARTSCSCPFSFDFKTPVVHTIRT